MLSLQEHAKVVEILEGMPVGSKIKLPILNNSHYKKNIAARKYTSDNYSLCYDIVVYERNKVTAEGTFHRYSFQF